MASSAFSRRSRANSARSSSLSPGRRRLPASLPVLLNPVAQGPVVDTQVSGDLRDRLTGLPRDAYRTLAELPLRSSVPGRSAPRTTRSRRTRVAGTSRRARHGSGCARCAPLRGVARCTAGSPRSGPRAGTARPAVPRTRRRRTAGTGPPRDRPGTRGAFRGTIATRRCLCTHPEPGRERDDVRGRPHRNTGRRYTLATHMGLVPGRSPPCTALQDPLSGERWWA
jgi:hypothetical protein